jgi:MFS family permease
VSQNSKQLVLLILFRLTRSVAAGIIILVFPYYVLQSLHYSALELGLLYTSATVATAGFALLFGFLTDLWGHKGTLVLAGILLPVGALLAFSSGKLSVLFIATMLGGFSATGSRAAGSVGGAAQPIQTAVIADLTTVEDRTFYFSLFTFLSGLLGAAGMLAARLFSPRDAFLVAAAVSAAGLAFLLPMKLSGKRGEFKRMKSGKVIGKFSLTGALNGVSQGLIMPFLIPFFVIVYHVPKSRMAVYGFASEMVAAFAILVAPRLEREFGFVKGVAVTRGAGALLLLLLPLTRIFALAVAVYMITPTLRVVAVPAQQTALTAMVRESEVGRAVAMNQVARLTASSGAVAFTGYMFELSDIALPFYAYALVTGVGLLLYFKFFGVRPELRAE